MAKKTDKNKPLRLLMGLMVVSSLWFVWKNRRKFKEALNHG
ncbi:hypothetical protein [Pediococcus acidilactici]|nr:hypothetical protein [Pediococcus acidilactici]